MTRPPLEVAAIVSAEEFLRRFLLHVLPRGFVRIRSFGFLANRCRALLLPLCQRLLSEQPEARSSRLPTSSTPACFRCPQCGTPMLRLEILSLQPRLGERVGCPLLGSLPGRLAYLLIGAPSFDSS
jgi:Putative transposase